MISGVNTETGVQKSTKIVLAKEKGSRFTFSKKTMNKEVISLNQLKDSLMEGVFKLSSGNLTTVMIFSYQLPLN